MDADTIRNAFKVALQEVQSASNFACPEITDSLIPLRDLQGFDSLSAVDAEVRLSQRLGFEIVDLPFKSQQDGHELSISEIISLVQDRTNREKVS